MTYRPRPQSKRFLDGDCPAEVLAIYDDPQFIDRYTVFYRTPTFNERGEPWIGYRGMSVAPSSPTGIGQFNELPAHQARAYRARAYRQSTAWSSLPEAVKDCVRRDCQVRDDV